MKRTITFTTLILAAIIAVSAAVPRSASSAPACQDSCNMSDMPGMDHMNAPQPDMTNMGPHMTMTPAMPSHPGDEQRAAKIVATLSRAIERYKSYQAAEQDGFMPFHPEIPQPQYHFTNVKNAIAAQFAFDATKPTSLLYKKTGNGYELIGAMFTAPRTSTFADLNARAPLSIAHWHEHVNFCKAPAGATRADYLGPNARFGLKGSIATADACQAAGGTFLPVIFNWMVHVYPYERNAADVWKVGH
jgi:hypothetical protein